jgi:hypothetical protein
LDDEEDEDCRGLDDEDVGFRGMKKIVISEEELKKM